MSKICSETFWMREPCRNTNGMPFVRGFCLALKGTACKYSEQVIFPPCGTAGQPWILRQFPCIEEKGGLGVRRVPAGCFLLEAEHKMNPHEYV